MSEIFAFIEQHWALVSAFFAGLLYLTRHLISEQQKTARLDLALQNLKTDGDTRHSDGKASLKELDIKIDDYHIKAVAREEALRKEAQHLVDKARIDIGRELTLLERELRTDIGKVGLEVNRLGEAMSKHHELLIEIASHNKQIASELSYLMKAKQESDTNVMNFWKEYGALLPELKSLVRRYGKGITE